MKTTKTTNGKTAISEQVDQPILFFIDNDRINQIDNEINNLVTNLNTFLDEFLKVSGQPLDFDNFARILKCADKWTGGSDMKFGVTYARKIASELVRSITGSEADMRYFEKALDKVQHLRFCGADGTENTLQFLALNDNKVIIKYDVESHKNIFRSYATTPDQKTRLANVRGLCATMEKFIIPEVNPESFVIRNLYKFNRATNKYEPERNYILTGTL